ncbi:MAG: Ribonuclease, partial [Frankiales bacterium]|nr:Ribonuclease [Frankiales bacterium]
MLAKYATTCGSCGISIRPGEEIAALAGGSRGRWAHTLCADTAGTVAVEAAGESLFEIGGATPAPEQKRAPKRAPRPSLEAAPADGATEVWTDGACSGNPGPGGWAWATRDGRQGYGSSPMTTNQRMEVQAALEAITALDGPLIVVSDSTYVVNCFRDAWWKGWLSRGWVNSAKQPIANRDLWEPLINLYRERGDVTFRWVKGHSGDA